MTRRLGLVLAPFAVLLAGCNGCNQPSQGREPAADAAKDATDAGLVSESKSTPAAAPSVIASYLNPGNLPAYTGATGILEGTVYVRGPAAPALDPPAKSSCKNVRDYRLFREGPADADGRRPLADAVVGVTGYSGFWIPPKGDSVEVHVKDCAFDHRTYVLTFGQFLQVKNDEALNSGTFYAPKLIKDVAASQMIAAPGNSVKIYFRKPGRDLLVDVMGHGHLYADVYAAVHSLHVVTDAAGHFILPGVPVGEYDATAMHPAFDDGGVKQKLTFKPGETTHHDFELTYAPVGRDAGAPDAGPKRREIH